jgi:hypothetical protein
MYQDVNLLGLCKLSKLHLQLKLNEFQAKKI